MNGRLTDVPELSREEEKALFYCYRAAVVAKDQKLILELRNKIVLHNLGLVGLLVGRMKYRQSASADWDDSFQEGVSGLIRAIEDYNPDFDPERNGRFATYAIFWIRQRIGRYIDTHSEPTSSLDAPLRRQGRDAVFTVGDMCINKQEIRPDFRYMAEDKIELFRQNLARMLGLLEISPFSLRDKEIFKRRYGLRGLPPMTYEEAGEVPNYPKLSYQRAQQVCGQVWKVLETFKCRFKNDQEFEEELGRVQTLQHLLGDDASPLCVEPLKIDSEAAELILTNSGLTFRQKGISPPRRPLGESHQQKVKKAALAKKIVKVVAEAHKFEVAKLLVSGWKGRRRVLVRRIAAYLIHKDLGRSYNEIAQDLNIDSHVSVASGCQVIKRLIAGNSSFRDVIENTRQKYLPLIEQGEKI